MIEIKLVLSIDEIIGFAFNIFIVTLIFMIIGSIHASRFKFSAHGPAYVQKKQIFMHVHSRLRHFFLERYSNDQYFVEKISCIFSESLNNEILVNQGQKFIKKFQLLDGNYTERFGSSASKMQKGIFFAQRYREKNLILNSHVMGNV